MFNLNTSVNELPLIVTVLLELQKEEQSGSQE